MFIQLCTETHKGSNIPTAASTFTNFMRHQTENNVVMTANGKLLNYKSIKSPEDSIVKELLAKYSGTMFFIMQQLCLSTQCQDSIRYGQARREFRPQNE